MVLNAVLVFCLVCGYLFRTTRYYDSMKKILVLLIDSYGLTYDSPCRLFL